MQFEIEITEAVTVLFGRAFWEAPVRPDPVASLTSSAPAQVLRADVVVLSGGQRPEVLNVSAGEIDPGLVAGDEVTLLGVWCDNSVFHSNEVWSVWVDEIRRADRIVHEQTPDLVVA